MRPLFLDGMKSARCNRGLALIELVMVLVLLGILAIYAAPRLTAKDLDARGFHDETLAFLRYAQKSAIAQRRTVCVAFGSGPSTVTLTMAAAAGPSACPGNDMPGPDGRTPARIQARSGVTYAALPAGFQFNGLGQPYSQDGTAALTAHQVLQVSADGVPLSVRITVEAVTGYVH